VSSSAFETAVRLLKARAKSRARLEEALVSRGYAAADVTDALERVTQLGYLDDARYADAKARAGHAEGRSRGDVLRRLEADGIPAEVAEGAVKEHGFDDAAAAKQLLQKRKLSGAKAARFLAGRGFPEDVIEKLVGNVFTDSP
jgi:regulatory protein